MEYSCFLKADNKLYASIHKLFKGKSRKDAEDSRVNSTFLLKTSSWIADIDSSKSNQKTLTQFFWPIAIHYFYYTECFSQYQTTFSGKGISAISWNTKWNFMVWGRGNRNLGRFLTAHPRSKCLQELIYPFSKPQPDESCNV